MRVEAPVAGAKGLMQRVDAKIRATLPRQARVTRTEGNSVWVKFLGDGATDPESKFPSTVAGVLPATMGWVITLGGRKGLFVATGIPSIRPEGDYRGVSGTIDSPGTREFDTVSASFTGLASGRVYTADVTVAVVATGTGSSRTRVHPVVHGNDTYQPSASSYADWTDRRNPATFRYIMDVTPDSNGDLTFTPALTWITGTTTVYHASIAVSLS